MSKGSYSRGDLPHWDFAGAVQAVTFRLGSAGIAWNPRILMERWLSPACLERTKRIHAG